MAANVAAEEAAAAPVDPLDDVRAILTTIGCGAQLRDRVIQAHSITGMDDWAYVKPDETETFAKDVNANLRNLANRFGSIHCKKLAGYLTWYHDLKKRGQPVVAAEFTPAVMNEWVERFETGKAEKEADKPDVEVGKVKVDLEWWDWKESWESMLTSKKGIDSDPLIRVVLPDLKPGETAPNERLARLYELPRTGVSWIKDNATVWTLLQQACIGTNIYELIRSEESSQDGRKAWENVLGYCEGTGQSNKRTIMANRAISTDQNGGGLFWKDEYTFPYLDYVTKLQRAYSVIEKHSHVTAPAAMVTRMLDGIKNSTQEIVIAKAHVRNNLLSDWFGAISHMSTEIAVVYPPRPKGRQNQGGRRVSEMETGGRGRGGRGGDRSSRGNSDERHDPKNGWFHGVNCNKVKGNFPPDQFAKMGHEGREYVKRRRAESKARQASAVDVDNNKQQASGAGDEAADPGDDDASYSDKGGRSGNRFGRGAYNGKDKG